jgi:hypothetical protein
VVAGLRRIRRSARLGPVTSEAIVIDAVIVACGGEEEDRERFATAWRRLMMARQVIQL